MAFSLRLTPVRHTATLKDHVHSALLDAIVNLNVYDPSAELRLDERKLAQQYGVSRTPIREALARLEQDGFVEIRARKGVYIRRKALDEVLEMVTTWAALESMAARLATESATDEELRELRALAAKCRVASAPADAVALSKAHIRFHQRIVELSRCKIIAGITDALFLHMYAVRRRAMGTSDRAEHSVVDYVEIIGALERRDADLASQLVLKYAKRFHNHVRAMWPELDGD